MHIYSKQYFYTKTFIKVEQVQTKQFNYTFLQRKIAALGGT